MGNQGKKTKPEKNFTDDDDDVGTRLMIAATAVIILMMMMISANGIGFKAFFFLSFFPAHNNIYLSFNKCHMDVLLFKRS